MKYLQLSILFLLVACGQKKEAEEPVSNDTIAVKKPLMTDKSVRFLWREDQYDSELKDTMSTMVINTEYCKNISEPEKAALGYVATFVGSDCDWDGKATSDRSNLKCKILTALQLGYQCSETHLGFLRTWFKEDPKTLKSLENCPTTPFTATSQETFDEINLTVKTDTIKVAFKVDGVNLNRGDSWNYSEETIFVLKSGHLFLIETNRFKVETDRISVDDGESNDE